MTLFKSIFLPSHKRFLILLDLQWPMEGYWRVWLHYIVTHYLGTVFEKKKWNVQERLLNLQNDFLFNFTGVDHIIVH